MAITMNMSSNKIERDDDPIEAEYRDEIACTGWNPAVAMMPLQSAPAEKRSTMPAELAEMDVEHFMQKMYTLLS